MKFFSTALLGFIALTVAQPTESVSANLQARDPDDVGNRY